MSQCFFSLSSDCFAWVVYVVDVWAYVPRVLMHRQRINRAYLAIVIVVHAGMLVKIAVLVVNRISSWFMMPWSAQNHVQKSIIRVNSTKDNEIILSFPPIDQIERFENVFVVKLIVHPVKAILTFVHPVPLVMLSKIQIVLKLQKNVILVNIMILLKIGRAFLQKKSNDSIVCF